MAAPVKVSGNAPDGGSPSAQVTAGDLLYFKGTSPAGGAELWRSDGTPAGTFMVKDILAGTGWSSPGSFATYKGATYFTASDDAGGELWATRGTPDTTYRVKDINPGPVGSNPSTLMSAGGAL